MNSTSWELFFNNSNKLNKPTQAKQLVSTKDIAEIKLLLTEVVTNYLAEEEQHHGLKIYIDSELRNDVIEGMITSPPKVENSIEDWSKQIFGEQKFGMILMGLEQYSNSFAEKVATIVKPLLEKAGLPLNGVSFLFFMGNYGFTPFGIHKDATGEDGVLFHLGPKNKEFYTWDDPKYNAIEHYSEVFHNVSDMLEEGQRYELEPGDAMFIPHYVYHIGNTPEFSLSIVLDYINPPKDEFENELIKLTAEEKLLHHTEYMKPIRMDDSQSTLNESIDIQSIQKKTQIALTRKILRLKSNGGIRKKSNRVNSAIPVTGQFSFKGKAIFPFFMDDQDSSKTIIFARGHSLVKKSHPKLPQLIDLLNKGESISLLNMQKLMEPLWDLSEVYGFIQDLLSVEAILIENNHLS